MAGAMIFGSFARNCPLKAKQVYLKHKDEPLQRTVNRTDYREIRRYW